MSFDKELDRAVLNLKGFTEKKVKGTIFALCSRIIKESPVDTGRFRGNWQSSLQSPITSTKDSVDRSGASSINQAASVVQALDMGQTFFLTNNLPYAQRLEFGWSKQAPQGMLRINVERVRAALARA